MSDATRPRLTARSVVASVLLGADPPRLPTRVLVATGALLGVAEGTTRVAISRMVAAGELAPDGDGYRLTGPLVRRQVRQASSRTAETTTWDGTWRTAVVVGEARAAADRAELRDAMAALRFAELREGVWLRPDNLPAGRLHDAERVADDQCRWLSSTLDEPAALAAELWDLAAWAKAAEVLEADLAALVPSLERGKTAALAEGFVLSAAVLRHLQADPLLPAELWPDGWPGRDLREQYDRYDTAYRATLAAWHRSQAAR